MGGRFGPSRTTSSCAYTTRRGPSQPRGELARRFRRPRVLLATERAAVREGRRGRRRRAHTTTRRVRGTRAPPTTSPAARHHPGSATTATAARCRRWCADPAPCSRRARRVERLADDPAQPGRLDELGIGSGRERYRDHRGARRGVVREPAAAHRYLSIDPLRDTTFERCPRRRGREVTRRCRDCCSMLDRFVHAQPSGAAAEVRGKCLVERRPPRRGPRG